MSLPTFDRIEVLAGTTPHLVRSFTWDDDGSARDVSASSVYLRVYTDSTGSTLLFPQRTGVTTTPTNQATFNLLASDLSAPGTYYCEVWLVSAGDTQKWAGTFFIGGVASGSIAVVPQGVTHVNAEVVIASAVGGETVLPLAHVPLTGTLVLYRNGALELGYTRSGLSLTMTAPLLAGDKVVSFYDF